MKLHKVLLNNLNSLYGEHAIDFDEDLDGAPLFLIMGPTGSGKSTILDAICVALFGKTPRLTRATGKPDMDARHLMSYGTGRCRAEVVFSLKDAEGQRHTWRAVWECRRAREKPAGNLQDPERSLFRVLEDGSEELLVSDKRIKYFEPHFEEILGGMTVEDFQRSILLAQGEFAAFLRADEQVKASILERLTNTDTYRQIGQRAAARRREVDQELRALGARLDGLPLLGDEEERELLERLEKLKATLQVTRRDAERAQRARDWLIKRELLVDSVVKAQEALKARQGELDARSEELAMLSEDRRCREAEPLMRLADELTARLTALTSQEPELKQALLDRVKELESQTTTQQQTQDKLKACRVKLERLKPELQRARALSERVAGAEKERQRAERELVQAAELGEDAAARQRDAADAVSRCRAALEALTTERARVALTPQQLALVKALESAVERLKEHEETLSTRRQRFEQSASRLAALAREREELAPSLIELTEQVERASEALQGARERLGERLHGEPDARARRAVLKRERDAASASLAASKEARAHHLTLVARRGVQAEQRRAEQDAVARREQLLRERAALAAQHEELKPRALARRLALKHLERQMVLFEHRHALHDEQPCPLCGSAEHPFLESADHDQAERALSEELSACRQETAQIDEALDAIEQKQRAHELEAATLRDRLELFEQRQRELHGEVSTLLDQYNGSRQQLYISKIDTFPDSSEAQREALETLNQAQHRALLIQQECDAELEAIERLEAELERVERAHREAETKQREELTRRDALAARSELLEAELAERREDLSRAQASRDEASQRGADAIAGLPSLEGDEPQSSPRPMSLDELEAHSARLTARRHRAHEIEEQLTQAKLEFDDSTRALEKLALERERFSTRREELQSALTAREQAVVELRLERAEALDGQDADLVEERHEREIQQLDVALKVAANLHAQARSEFERARTRHEAHSEQLKEHATRTASSERELTEKLEALQIGSRQELVSALLDASVRERLEQLGAALHRERDSAERDLARASQELAEHQAAQPEIESLRERSIAEWSSAAAALEREIEDQLGEQGALKEKASTQRQAKERAADYRDELEALRERANIWETIYRLIGIKDGESFKQFAQSLNLQELVDRANVRLERLAPRYELAVASGEHGEPRLDFAIRDRHQAEAERPLTTLSGGETFLVSLALALALSDFRRVEMPVETLLLDEGFGTLDQETLDVAMRTLGQLQQENVQQIGIISHVEGLKERVDARIVVEKLGNGRSALRIEAAR